MQHKITWQATSDPSVFRIDSTTDAPFQVAKDDAQLAAEKASGGAPIAGCATIDDELDTLPDGRRKVRFKPGRYVTLDGSGKPSAVVSRPLTDIRTPAELEKESKLAKRVAAREKVRTADPATLTLEDAFDALGLREPTL